MVEDLAVYQKMYAFVKWLIPKTQQFPKSQRFTMAQRIDALALEILELVIDANESRDKAESIHRALVKKQKLQSLIRLSMELEFLDFRAYEQAAARLVEMGRLLGGWKRWQATQATA